MLSQDVSVPLKIAAYGLLLAVLPIMPYGYYILLRLAVCGVSGYIAYQLREFKGKQFWFFVGVAILFNPIFIVALSRLVWLPIDIILAVIFLKMAKKLNYQLKG